jgi:hypothetical protein
VRVGVIVVELDVRFFLVDVGVAGAAVVPASVEPASVEPASVVAGSGVVLTELFTRVDPPVDEGLVSRGYRKANEPAAKARPTTAPTRVAGSVNFRGLLAIVCSSWSSVRFDSRTASVPSDGESSWQEILKGHDSSGLSATAQLPLSDHSSYLRQPVTVHHCHCEHRWSSMHRGYIKECLRPS